MKNAITLTIYFTLLGFTGCVALPSMPKVDLASLKPPGPVTAVVAAWEPAVSNGENSMRGLGGRVYFHDQDMRPAKVKGQVIVYIFDEEGRRPGNEKPDEGIVFDEKMLKDVYKKSNLGHSYNLFVPLDAAAPDGPAKKVSLIVRYIPEKGASIVSSQATVHVPGRREQIDQAGLQPVDWRESTSGSQIASRSASARSAPPFANDANERIQSLQAVTIR
jgi:hypothetical protein